MSSSSSQVGCRRWRGCACGSRWFRSLIQSQVAGLVVVALNSLESDWPVCLDLARRRFSLDLPNALDLSIFPHFRPSLCESLRNHSAVAFCLPDQGTDACR